MRLALAFLCATGILPGADLAFSNYRVFYDPAPHGRRSTSVGLVQDGANLDLVFTDFVQDDEAGALPYLVRRRNGAETWSPPAAFGTEIFRKLGPDPKQASSALSIFGPTPRGTTLAVGFHVAKGARPETYHEDLRFRTSSLIIGRRERGRDRFEYQAYPSGTFLGEQFAYGGVIHPSGRIVLQVWGASKRGENWQCGVLLSDDDGRHWRYRQVGYEPSLEIRDQALTPAGFNEQTLFTAAGGTLISIIRGREKLGRVTESPKDTWFFRSESRDRGETWSRPEPTTLAGTGASGWGVTLADGSILMACRIPYSRTLYKLKDGQAFGLHLARSFDQGRTWRTEHLIQADPDGRPFDNYYNAMNGQFLSTGEGRWMYVFPQFSVKHKIHRMLGLDLRMK